jgi:hypothetical protein
MNSFVQIRLTQLYQWIHGFNLSRVLANRSENTVAVALSKMKVVIFVVLDFYLVSMIALDPIP